MSPRQLLRRALPVLLLLPGFSAWAQSGRAVSVPVAPVIGPAVPAAVLLAPIAPAAIPGHAIAPAASLASRLSAVPALPVQVAALSPVARAARAALAGPVASALPTDGGLAAAYQRLSPASAAAAERARLVEEAARSTSLEVKRILKARAKGATVRQILASKDTKTITEYNGVPGRVRELADYGRVYRHWVRDAEDLQSILSSGRLKAGAVSYVEFTGSSHAYIKDIYPDLHGPFFTVPEKSSAEPRVMNEKLERYVDFRIPPGVRALSLDGEDVLMIPAERGAYIPIDIVSSSAK